MAELGGLPETRDICRACRHAARYHDLQTNDWPKEPYNGRRFKNRCLIKECLCLHFIKEDVVDEEAVDPKGRWFVIVDREHNPSLIIGPYESKDRALWALDSSVFIDGLAEEDSLEIMAIQLEMATPNGPIEYILPPTEEEENERGVFTFGVQETQP